MYALYYDFSQTCLTLLTSCTNVTYANYNTTSINETFINNFFAITLQLLYWIKYPTNNNNNNNNRLP